MAYMQNKQMPIRNYGALRNMMLAQNTAPNPYRSPAWMEQIARQKALENQPMPSTPNRPIWTHSDGTPATPAEIRSVLGGDLKINPNVPIGERGIDYNAIRNNPNRRQDIMNELDTIPSGQMPRGTGFAEQGGYEGKVYNTPRGSIWDEMENLR